MATTDDQLKAALTVLSAVAEAIRDVGIIPAGHLYAAMMGNVDLPTFDRIIGILTNCKLIEKSGNSLRWIGEEVQ